MREVLYWYTSTGVPAPPGVFEPVPLCVPVPPYAPKSHLPFDGILSPRAGGTALTRYELHNEVHNGRSIHNVIHTVRYEATS